MKTLIIYNRFISPRSENAKDYFKKRNIEIILLTSITRFREDIETYSPEAFIIEYELALSAKMRYMNQLEKYFPDIPVVISLPDFIGDRRIQELKKSNVMFFINDSITKEEELAFIETLDRYISLRKAKETLQKEYDDLKEKYDSFDEVLQGHLREKEDLKKYIENIEINDPLTGLSNERYFLMQTGAILDECNRYKDNVCISQILIDNIEQIEELYQSQGADHIIKEVGDMIKRHIRSNDCAGIIDDHSRFLVTYKKINPQSVRMVSQRLKDTLEDHVFVFEEKQIRITVSIGMASSINYFKNTFELTELYAQARIALDNAVKKGKNTLVAYS